MMDKKRRLVMAVVGLALALALADWLSRPAPPRYAVTDLGVLPGATESSASGLNNRGDVVGVSGPERRDLQHAFLYHNGVLTDLGLFGLMSTHDGPTINDRGQITGVLEIPGAPPAFHVLLYDAGRRRDLGTSPGYTISLGDGINGHGQIAGQSFGHGTGSSAIRAFLYSGSGMTDIGVLPGARDVLPTGLNDGDQVVGDCVRQDGGIQAFTYDRRTRKMTPLATPPGLNSDASGINNQGQIIGCLAPSEQKSEAVLWEGSRRIALGTLPGTDGSEGAAVNNAGVAVGTAKTQPNALGRLVGDHPIRLGLLTPLAHPNVTGRAFVYQDGRIQDLNALIPAHSGWTLESATAINDRGQIVGRGLHDGQARAFLLTPMP